MGVNEDSVNENGISEDSVSKDDVPVVLSVEQALSMSYATLRFVQLGWRVIRVEATPVPGRQTAGDPNRSIGRPVAGEDRHSYFVAPNVGKEAIALNLKTDEGRALLARLVRELPVDVFCTNTLPKRHRALGMDYATLKEEREDLIWCGISAMGLAHPNVPGYDPAIQALCGYMDITGDPQGPPMQNGPPIIDLKAGDEAFTQVIVAMMERMTKGKGRAIDVSMAQVAASWLLTFLPMLEMGVPASDLRRSGNEHRQFIPTNAYPTSDGFVYLAIGSDAQWRRLAETPLFASLDQERYQTNEGRREGRVELHASMAEITGARTLGDVAEVLGGAAIPHAPITPIEGVMELPFLKDLLLRTRTPDGRTVRLPPPAVATDHLEACGGELGFAPSYGGDTDDVLGEVGVSADEIRGLRAGGVIA